jgi:hypothetical protein
MVVTDRHFPLGLDANAVSKALKGYHFTGKTAPLQQDASFPNKGILYVLESRDKPFFFQEENYLNPRLFTEDLLFQSIVLPVLVLLSNLVGVEPGHRPRYRHTHPTVKSVTQGPHSQPDILRPYSQLATHGPHGQPATQCAQPGT